MAILGLDYGKVRIGWAISVKDIIEPGGVIENKDLDQVVLAIKKLCQEYRATKVILGMVVGGLSGEIYKLAKKLKSDLGIRIEFINERLTSCEAGGLIGKTKDKSRIDQVAAALILQRWQDNMVK